MRKVIITCFLFGSLFVFCFLENTYALSNVSLTVLGTKINEVVVQGDDNEFYLNHNSIGNKDIRGATFLDYRNNIQDKKLIIYGHNSDTLDIPFQDLEGYLEEKFYENHKFIFLTVDNETSIYQVFSTMITSSNEHTRLGFSNQKYSTHLAYLKSNSLYDTKVKVYQADKILVIQTCNYHPVNSFIVVSAKKIGGDIYEIF